jgi:PAS domain S-box-containing protein
MPFILPSSALYGRNNAIAKLSQACLQISPTKPIWILVEGTAGIGKTSLVKFVRKTLQLSDTQFGGGKFEQFHRQTPYSALIAALRTLLQTVIALPGEERAAWQTRLSHASDNRLGTLIDVLPELTSLVDAIALPAPLPPRDAQSRLESAFAHLISFFARPDHPLLLFLDDLQWADVATLRLLRSLGTEEQLGHLIILGTYRDNEVTPLHPLTQTLLALEERRLSITRIQLGPLSQKDVEEWLSDVCGFSSQEVSAPAQWITQQSEGNPLFIRQLLNTLRKRGVLHQQRAAKKWTWKAERLEDAHVSGNIVTFMESRLRELPEAQQTLLSHAACLGAQFSIDELALIMHVAPARISALLKLLQEAQLLDEEKASSDKTNSWRFVHDRIQQAAYRLVPDTERTAQHLRIGRTLLLATTSAEELDRRCFDLVAQFNHAKQLLTPQEHLTVAELNYRAGCRAKSSAAFEAALSYLSIGLGLLADSAWETHYDLIFGIVRECAECAYATGDVKEANRLFELALKHARSQLDRARIYGIMIMFSLNSGRTRDAWELGATCLASFDIEILSDPAKLEEAIERDEPGIRARIASTTLDQLLTEPSRLTEEQNIVADILLRLYTAGYQMGKLAYTFITIRMLDFGLQTHHQSVLAMGLVNFAVTIPARHGAYAEADRYSQMALEMSARLTDATIQARIDYMYGAMVAHWTRPISVGLQALEHCQEQSQLTADKVYIGLALSFQFRTRMLAGDTSASLLAFWESTVPAIRQINSWPMTTLYAMNHQWIRAWREETRAPAELDSDEFDTAAVQAQLEALPAKSPYHWFLLLRAILAYMHGQYASAMEHIKHADSYLDAVSGQLAIPAHHFWRGLIMNANGDVGALSASLELMESWSANCPQNFGRYALLLRAELRRAQGDVEAALDAYHEVARGARDSQRLFMLALALERSGDYYLEQKLMQLGRAHLQESMANYRLWGAPAKVRQLQEKYPADTSIFGYHDKVAPLTSNATLAALSEIRLDRLWKNFLPILGAAYQATRVAAVVARDRQLMVEAQYPASQDETRQPLPLPLEHARDYPAPLIATGCAQSQPFVIAVPAAHPDYARLACWQSHPAAASLVLPISRHGRLLGALYLERAQGEWPDSSLAELAPLLIQVATALENALLYAELEQQIGEKTRAEKVAREGERRWRGFLEHAHMAVVSLDLEGHIQYVNPFLKEMMGLSEDELIGKDWTKLLLAPQYREKPTHETLLKELYEHGHFNGLVKLRTKNGEDRTIAWSNSLLRDPDGRPIGSIGIGSDMTDQRKAERALLQLNAELELRVTQRTSELAAANRELDSFAYSISHDLRAPLRSIDGFSQALWEDYQAQLDETAQDYIQRVRAATKRMGGMIDAVLNMSRQTRGEIVMDEVDLSDIAGEVIEELAQRTPERSVHVTIQPNMTAQGASRLIRIVLENLLGNAWKYTVSTPHAAIQFSVTVQDNVPIYRISDNGPGFDMAYASKLFTAFQRLYSGNDVEGHGIGLATVQRIIHRHGGKIWAESEPGSGASFFFTLQAQEQASAAEARSL